MLGFLLWFSLTAGVQQGELLVGRELYMLSPAYVRIEMHAENEYVDIYGIYENHMDISFFDYLWPTLDFYTIGVRFHFGQISVAFEHQCAHPVVPFGIWQKMNYNSGYNRVEVTISSKKSAILL